MVWEMTGIMCQDIVVIIACDSTNNALVYKRKASEFIEQAAQIYQEFNKLTPLSF
jgi:hypothetical protein